AGDGPVNPKFGMTTRQVSIFFSVYVFFQVWNEINCRALTPETSGFHNILHNWTFLSIVGTIAGVQVLITSVPGLASVCDVEPLNVLDWLLILAFTSTVLIFAEIVRQIRLRQREASPSLAPRPA